MKIACVLKMGGPYGPEHVIRLRDMVPRMWEMVCLTDCSEHIPGVHKQALNHQWSGWWSKLELFDPRHKIHNAVYLDLDVDVTGDLSLLQRDSLRMPRDFINQTSFNSSVMTWGRQPHAPYFTFKDNPEKYMKAYKKWPKIGDQAFIADHYPVDMLPDGLVRSFRLECVDGIPEETIVIAYHGRPKPWEI